MATIEIKDVKGAAAGRKILLNFPPLYAIL